MQFRIKLHPHYVQLASYVVATFTFKLVYKIKHEARAL